MSNKRLIAIVDCYDTIHYLESLYHLERYQVKEAIEAIILSQIDIVISNHASQIHDIGNGLLNIYDFIPDMIATLSDSPENDLGWGEVLHHVSHVINETRLIPFWDEVKSLDLDITQQNIGWKQLDLYIHIN